MFGITKRLADYTNKIDREDPRGRRYVTVPWKDMTYIDQLRLPFHFRSEFPVSEILISASWIMIAVGALTSFGVSFAFGIAFLITLHLSTRAAWRDSGAWDILSVEVPKDVLESTPFTTAITIKNTNEKHGLHNIIVSVRFNGAVREFQCQMIAYVPPRGSAVIRFPLTADRGMGVWTLSEVTVTVRDTLGLRVMSLEHPFTADIQVNAEHSTLAHFEIERAGLSLHTGDYEVKAPGHSTSFLGLRDWRHGDSLTHIDWKRSMRSGNLLVKEFERMCATDATIFLDTSDYGHGEFAGTSTIEAMKDTAMAVIRCLIAQQVQVQVITPHFHIPLGKSQSHVDYIIRRIRDIKPEGQMNFSQLVLNNIHNVQADSVAVMILTSANAALDSLLQSFVLLDDRRIETNLAVINTNSFLDKIRTEANLDLKQNQILDYIMQQMASRNQSAGIKRVLEKVTRHMYVINPETTFADVYNLKHGH